MHFIYFFSLEEPLLRDSIFSKHQLLFSNKDLRNEACNKQHNGVEEYFFLHVLTLRLEECKNFREDAICLHALAVVILFDTHCLSNNLIISVSRTYFY